MVSPRSVKIRARLEQKKRIAPLFDPGISLATQRAELDKSGKRAVPLPDQQIEPISMGGIPVEWVKVGTQTSSHQVLLYVHGGAVEDVIVAYCWLLASSVQAHEIALAGDSASGSLALAALLSLRDVGEPLPAAVVLLSPWIDLTETSASRSTHAEADPYLTPQFMLVAARQYLGAIDPRTSPASPLFGDLAGLPPLPIQVGTDEIFQDDSLWLAERVQEAGGAVTLEIWEGMWHVGHYFASLIPEGQQSFDQIGEFIRTHLDQEREAQRGREATESDYFHQFQQRAKQLQRRYIEPSMTNVLELPRKLRDLFHWLMQQGEAELKQVAAHLNQDAVTTRTQLSNLIVRGFVQEREGEDEGQLHYRVRMRARRGRLVSDELSQDLRPSL